MFQFLLFFFFLTGYLCQSVEEVACYEANRRIYNMRDIVLAISFAWILATERCLGGKLERFAHRPNNVLDDYYAYRHISIIHFNVPDCTVTAGFK